MLICATLAAAAGSTEVYKTVDPEHGVEFSDTPSPGAERIVVQPPAVIDTRPPPPPVTMDESAEPAAFDRYEQVAIASPADQETIRDNNGNVLVNVSVTPALQAERGHRLALLLDGAPYGEPGTATNFALTAIDRGTHTLRAVIVDAQGATLVESPPITVFLHRHSIKLPARQKPPAPKPAAR